MMRTEKRVFEVPLTEDNYDKNIKYTDDFTWSDNDKKNIQSFIWNQILNLTDLEGEMKMDTAHGKLLIRFKANPPDSPKRRFKQVEGFLLQEVPDTMEVQSTQEPEIKETQDLTGLHPVQQFDAKIKSDFAFFTSLNDELKGVSDKEKTKKIVDFARRHGFPFSEDELVALLTFTKLANPVETQESTTTPPLTQENVSSSIELKHYRIILKNGVREEFDASRYEERNEQYQFYKEDAKIAFVLVSSVVLMRWS